MLKLLTASAQDCAPWRSTREKMPWNGKQKGNSYYRELNGNRTGVETGAVGDDIGIFTCVYIYIWIYIYV